MDQACASEAPKFIYAIKNAAFPGLIKIGRTQNVKERLSQLNTACAPSPFLIVAVSPSLDYIRDEKKAHDFFSDHRKEGEFFDVTESQVREFFKTVQKNYEIESQQPSLQAQKISRNNTRKAQVESFLKIMLAGTVKEAKDAQTSVPELDQNSQISRKRQLELEDELFEMEMAERKQRLLQSMIETQKTLQEQYTALCPGKVLDDRARLLFQDKFLNLMSSQGIPAAAQLAEEGIPVSAQEDTRPITISMFAAEEGKCYDTKDLQQIEDIMSSLYEKKYGKKASLCYESCQELH
jgi:hypothetical protein